MNESAAVTETPNGRPGLAEIIDLERYPIHQPECAAYRDTLERVRAEMREKGCARIADFVREDIKPALEAEVAAISDKAVMQSGAITPYFNDDEPERDPSHPRRRFNEFSSGFVAMDWFPEDGICLTLYRSDEFRRFIADCLGEEVIYTFDDPLAGVVANVMPDGTTLPWHFDTNEFIVSLMTRAPNAGGTFEYCPEIREPGNENYEAVQAVMDGDRERVRELDLRIGDLQIFKGRFSMHRVVKCEGERHTAIFGYAKKPGFIGRVQRTREVHGRVTQAHIDAEAEARDDGLND
jgi:hypothetical protein